MTTTNNSISLIGCMTVPGFAYNHVVNGEHFYSFTLEIERISGTKDYIPVIISERLIDGNIAYDTPLCVEGEFRSHNMKVDGKVHLALYVFAQTIYPMESAEYKNEAIISGFLCKKPVYRTTPFGRQITDMMLAVPRLCGKTDYIPCICWGRNAVYASKFDVGTQITASGRIQSRTYIKMNGDAVENKVAYELSIDNLQGEKVWMANMGNM